ncbi:MAG: LptF/LptG family permease [Puia sp.]|nr:LptF/LptG family permease [Puia sp.]
MHYFCALTDARGKWLRESGKVIMLTILDRYILRKFFSTFIFTILVITVIAVVIDTSEKADDFVRSGLSSWQLVTHYYFGFVPFIVSMIFPLMIYVAVIYFTSKMAGRSEFIAILAGGVRYNRMLRPYVIGSVLLATLFWVASQFWVPRANEIRTDFQANYVDRNSSYNGDPYKNNNYYLRVDSTTFVSMRYYDTSQKSASSFFMQRIRGNKIYYNMRAESIKWDPVKKDWKLRNIIERNIDGLHETVRKLDTLHVNLNVLPRELKRDDYLKDKMTSPELKQFIYMEKLRGTEGLSTYKVERYRRDATPFSVIIMTLMGAIIASRKVRGGSGLQMAIGLVTASIFVVMDKFSVTFAQKGDFPPMLAAWLPNIIFSGVALLLYYRTAK